MEKLKIIFLFIIFSNLILIQSAPVEDLVKDLPNYPYKRDLYSGYLDTAKPERKIFYLFAPSQSESGKDDPLIVWLNGGPGCSGLDTFIAENGPAVFDVDEKTIKLNEFSWNKKANVLYLESPVGVGYSYSTLGKDDLASDDEKSAVDNLAVMLSFRKKFPEYENNDFYISGQSYGGIYGPYLATKILEDGTFKSFKGLIIGNGVTDWTLEVAKSLLEFALGHQLITKDEVDDYYKNCVLSKESLAQNIYKPYNCLNSISRVKNSLEGLNIYDILRTCPREQTNDNLTNIFNNKMASTISMFKKISKLQKQSLYGEFYDKFNDPDDMDLWPTPCRMSPASTNYFNLDSVKEALHAKKDTVWEVCSTDISHYYYMSVKGSIYLYPNILKSGIKVLFYSGDSDACVPFTGSIKWIQNLKLPIKSQYDSWVINGQVVGYTQEYEGLTYTTIKGTGHLATGWKREECFTMLNKFIKKQ